MPMHNAAHVPAAAKTNNTLFMPMRDFLAEDNVARPVAAARAPNAGHNSILLSNAVHTFMFASLLTLTAIVH